MGQIMSKARSVSLRTVDTGHVFATTNSLRLSDRWDWISSIVAPKYDCQTCDLDLMETDDGDVVTLRGEPIVEIHDCYLTNASRPLALLREVA
jgi:hypothetical protein